MAKNTKVKMRFLYYSGKRKSTMLVSLWKVTSFYCDSSSYQIYRTIDIPIAQEYVSKKTSVGIWMMDISLCFYSRYLMILWKPRKTPSTSCCCCFFPEIYVKILGSHDENKQITRHQSSILFSMLQIASLLIQWG